MSKASFVPFSMMGEPQKAKVDDMIDTAYAILKEIRVASHAAKENLMKTDFKVAGVMLSFVGKLLQSESAMVQAVTVMADRAGKSEDFRGVISANLPNIILPHKQLKK